MGKPEYFDAVVIGGGIFGCYAALYLAGQGRRVALLEKESRLFQKASLVNQARLHGGYHYPRSIATAALSDEHKERFTAEHRPFVHFSFEQYYAIDRFGSFTDAEQFERFCRHLHIRCERVTAHSLFNFNRLESLYRTEEYSFDPVLLREYYTRRVEQHPGISVLKPVRLFAATSDDSSWLIELQTQNSKLIHEASGQNSKLKTQNSKLIHETSGQNSKLKTQNSKLQTPLVINATYSASNAVNQLFGVSQLDLTHEISEIAFITSRQFRNMGLTVMDGPFGSVMPYGLSGLLSLSSVAYTHHKISYGNLPRFDCQIPDDPACTPEAPGICTNCPRRPASNAYKMLRQMQQYFSDAVQFEHLFSYFTIKSKLKANYIDDGRPTEIAQLADRPAFYCLFAGKVNSIYEIEKIV